MNVSVTELVQLPPVQRSSSRDRLLLAARSLILECGVDDLRVGEITDRADVGVGSFYTHFGTKDAIVEAVALDTLTQLTGVINGVGETIDDPAEVISMAIRWIVDLGTSAPDLSRLVLRLEASNPALEGLIVPLGLPYYERGVASGRFVVSDVQLAIRMTVAGMMAALRAVVNEDSGPETGSTAAETALLCVGLDRDEARRVATLDLPLLPGGIWERAAQEQADLRLEVPAGMAKKTTGPVVRVSVSDQVMRLELNRPQALNALNREMVGILREAVARAAADDDVRCVVLTTAGRGFCSGWDVANPGPDDEGILDELLHPLIREIHALPKPVVAVVRGGAVGYGCALALAADVMIAAQSAYFLLAFAKIGLSGDGGVTATLPARVGLGRATRMMLMAEKVPGPEALAIGLVDYLVADAEVDAVVEQVTGRLATGPTRSYRATKQLLGAAALPDLDAQLDRERDHADELVTTEDYAEGLLSFAERRPPRFRGR